MKDYLEKEHKGESVSGDALACWIADWIISLRQAPQEENATTPYDYIDAKELKRWLRYIENAWRDQYEKGVTYKDFPAMADGIRAVRNYISGGGR